MPIKCTIPKEKPEMLLFVECIEKITSSEFDDFKTVFYTHLKGPNTFKVFIDLRKLTDASPSILSSLVKFINTSEELAIDKVLATSVLVNKPHIENLVNIVFNLKKPATPTKVTSDLTVACNFLHTVC